jgi:hypothetical protein
MTVYNDVISEVLKKLDDDYAKYQDAHVFYHNSQDEQAKLIYNRLIQMCKNIRKEIAAREKQ